MGACHCTSDGQEHKIIWRAGPERERIFHLRVTACRQQGSHCRHERLAWVASRYGGRGLRAPAHSSRKSWERTTTELTTFILCTNGGQEVTFEPTSNAHARVDYNTCCIDLIKPNQAAFYLRHGHYRSHCNHRNVYSQVCHHVYVLCRNEEIIEMCNDKVSATSF